jgi:hypothetical protein
MASKRPIGQLDMGDLATILELIYAANNLKSNGDSHQGNTRRKWSRKRMIG